MTGNVLRLALPATVDAPGIARTAVQDLRDRASPEVLERVAQLVSELVSAAVRAADLEAQHHVALSVQVDVARIRVDVAGAARGLAGRRLERALPDALDWSLYFVAQLADRWGVERKSASAWFEIDLEPQPKEDRNPSP
jgi:hypothetical protein